MMPGRGGWGKRDATGAGASNLFEYVTQRAGGEDEGVKSLKKIVQTARGGDLGNVMGRE